MSDQHTALLLSAVGAAFEVGKRDTPKPGPGQVLIRNKAAALNPVDVLIQKTGYIVSAFGYPAVTGCDGAGEIVALGAGVEGPYKIGDKVFYQSIFLPDSGTFQEFSIAYASLIAKIPSNLSYEQIVTVPLTLATAAIGAYKPKSMTLAPEGYNIGGAGLTPPWVDGGRGKYAGQAAVILGGSSSVGRFALQLAKLSGFSFIITTASKRNEEYCKDAGATHVIDYQDVPYAELPAAVKKIVSNVPLKYVYDAASTGASQKAGWDMLSPDGVLIVTLPPSPDVGAPGKVHEGGRQTVNVAGIAGNPVHQEFGAGLYLALPELLAKGEIKPNKVESIGHGLEVIPGGLERIEKGAVSGVKLVVTL